MARYFIGKNIVINSFKDSPNIEQYTHFVTHVSNSLTSVPPNLFDRNGCVYTSAFFAWYLVTFFGVNKDVFVPIDFGREHTVYNGGQEITFVFIKNPTYEPSFMILFKSDTGDELFAGSCRFSDGILEGEVLRPYTISKRLSKIHFDGTYVNCHRLPSSTSVLRSVVDTIRTNRRKVVYVSADRLGNEVILCTIAKALNKKIYVSPEKFLVLDKLGIGDSFTTELTTTYIRAMDYNQISVRKQLSRNRLVGPSIAIVLSAKIFFSESRRDELSRANIHVLPVTSLNTPAALPVIKRLLADSLFLTNFASSPANDASSCEYPSSSLPLPSDLYRRRSLKKVRCENAGSELDKISPQYRFKWRGCD